MMYGEIFHQYTCLWWKCVSYTLLFVPLVGFLVLLDWISFILNIWLSWQYPIKNIVTGISLPTVRYKFPNGQGDGGKFLRGRENSLEWENKHGPLYCIWSGSNSEVVLTRYEHIKEVFKDSDKHIKALNNNSGYFMGEILGKCVGLISNDEWKHVRTVCERPFHRPTIGFYIQNMEHQTHCFFDNLWKCSRLSESIIDPAKDLKYLPFWIISEILYGQLSSDMKQELEEIAPRRERLFQHVIAGGLSRFNWSKYLPTSANRELHEFKTQWSCFNRRVRDIAIAQDRDITLLQMYKAVDNGEISEEQLLQTLDEMLYANLDATLSGISWNLVFLAAYPEAQDLLRTEISNKRQDSESNFSDYLLRTSTYLNSCISESSRLRPLAAFSVPQAIPTGRTIGGYYFPANTNFIVDSRALNQRSPYWGYDSSTFRPDRFLEKTSVQARYNFWRFRFGPRQCLGKHVGDAMIRVLLVYVVENFELDLLAKDEEWRRNPEVWINQPLMQLKCTVFVSGNKH